MTRHREPSGGWHDKRKVCTGQRRQNRLICAFPSKCRQPTAKAHSRSIRFRARETPLLMSRCVFSRGRRPVGKYPPIWRQVRVSRNAVRAARERSLYRAIVCPTPLAGPTCRHSSGVHMMASASCTTAMTRRSDNGPLSRLRFPRRCVAEVFAVLKPGSNLQRLFQLVVVDVGPAGGRLPVDSRGLRAGGQRLPPPPSQVGQVGGQVVQRAGQYRGSSAPHAGSSTG